MTGVAPEQFGNYVIAILYVGFAVIILDCYFGSLHVCLQRSVDDQEPFVLSERISFLSLAVSTSQMCKYSC